MFTKGQFLNTPYGMGVVTQEETLHHYMQYMDGNGKIHGKTNSHGPVTEIPWIIGYWGFFDPWTTHWAYCNCWTRNPEFATRTYRALNECFVHECEGHKALVCNFAKPHTIWLYEEHVLTPVTLSDHLLHASLIYDKWITANKVEAFVHTQDCL